MAVEAYVLIEVRPQKAKSALTAIKGLSGIKSCHAVTGPNDMIAFVEASDLKALGSMVVSNIGAVDGVIKTATCVVIELG